ncbi:MAG: helix-turn-helix domain-containing protein, partial [Clostridia bacterium]|nr:helix-turn-helix domain-containing protein [Clostridia bacterium]
CKMSKKMFTEYDEILSIEDVMEILHIGKNSVYSLLKSNEIRNIRVGKRYIVPKQSVINFITAITEN